MPKKKQEITDEDLALFQDAVKGTKRLDNNKERLEDKQLKNAISPSFDDMQDEHDMAICFDREIDHILTASADDQLLYAHVSISQKMLRKLRKGQYNVDAKLDLHGCTMKEAEAELLQFLEQAVAHHCRMVLIVHGKGRDAQAPKLKNSVNRWLRELSVVLAFSSALPKHGGVGAVYVLLAQS